MAYGEVLALDGLDLVAPADAITALLGPNGAGKTTFVRAAATLQPFAGSLTVAGIDVGSAPHEVRRRIGLAGQQAAVVERLTGRENLQLVARLFGQGRRQAGGSAEKVINMLALGDFADRLVSTYSGGERRRFDLGASLVAEPVLLLLDEPTTGLDPHSRQDLWRRIRELPDAGTSVLLTTQHLEEAEALADHVIVVDAGRVVANGTPTELRRATGAVSLTVRSEDPIPAPAAGALANSLRAELAVSGKEVSLVGYFSFAEASTAVDMAGLAPMEVLYRPPTLDEVFLALTDSAGRSRR